MTQKRSPHLWLALPLTPDNPMPPAFGCAAVDQSRDKLDLVLLSRQTDHAFEKTGREIQRRFYHKLNVLDRPLGLWIK
jgi:hypothetical protein